MDLFALLAARDPDFARAPVAEAPAWVRPVAAPEAPTGSALWLCHLTDHSLLYRDLAARLPAQRACVSRALRADPTLDQTVILRLRLDAEGALQELSLEGPPVERALQSCLLASLDGFVSPAPPGRGERIVRWPLHLHAAPPASSRGD